MLQIAILAIISIMSGLEKEIYCFYSMYSWIFGYLEKEWGKKAVEDYWLHIGSKYYGRLVEDIKKRGLAALKDYYDRYLSAEDGSEQVKVVKNEDMFRVDTHNCKAMQWLRTQKVGDCAFCQDSYYSDYCDHCRFINQTIARESGLSFHMEYNRQGKCTQVYRRR